MMWKCIIFGFALSAAATPGALADADMCIEVSCGPSRNNPNNLSQRRIGPGATATTNLDGQAIDSTLFCWCTRTLHVPQADELTPALEKAIKDAFDAGVNAALKAIETRIAEREAKLYEQLAKQEERANKQIELLTELLKQKISPPPKRSPKRASGAPR